MTASESLTERQRKWFASVRAGLEAQTGRTIGEWAEIARACPETKPRARLAWMKAAHGLGQNHATLVLAEAFPDAAGWSVPERLADALWQDERARALFEGLRAEALRLPDVVVGQRKGFAAFSRKLQFAAVRPEKGGGVLLGLALDPGADPRLGLPPRHASWSERLRASVAIDAPSGIDAGIAALLRAAWERS